MENNNSINNKLIWLFVVPIIVIVVGGFILGEGRFNPNKESNGVGIEIPTATSNIPPQGQEPNSSSSITINGVSYSHPTSNTPFCVSNEQTGYTSANVNYDLIVPKGWVFVLDSWKAYWPNGKYEEDGLLIIYGNWQGQITVVNGEYCAVPLEWEDFAINSRINAVSASVRPQFMIGEQP